MQKLVIIKDLEYKSTLPLSHSIQSHTMRCAVLFATLLVVAAISLHAEARSVSEYRDDSIDASFADSADEDISLRVCKSAPIQNNCIALRMRRIFFIIFVFWRFIMFVVFFLFNIYLFYRVVEEAVATEIEEETKIIAIKMVAATKKEEEITGKLIIMKT